MQTPGESADTCSVAVLEARWATHTPTNYQHFFSCLLDLSNMEKAIFKSSLVQHFMCAFLVVLRQGGSHYMVQADLEVTM